MLRRFAFLLVAVTTFAITVVLLARSEPVVASERAKTHTEWIGLEKSTRVVFNAIGAKDIVNTPSEIVSSMSRHIADAAFAMVKTEEPDSSHEHSSPHELSESRKSDYDPTTSDVPWYKVESRPVVASSSTFESTPTPSYATHEVVWHQPVTPTAAVYVQPAAPVFASHAAYNSCST